MLSFRFEYAVKPKDSYKIRYGLKNKPRPYSFNFPVGLKHGKYRFNYDRRGQIHIEKYTNLFIKNLNEIKSEELINPFIRNLHEVELEEAINPFIKKLHEIEERREKELEKIKYEILKEASDNILGSADRILSINNIDKIFKSNDKKLYKDISIELKRNKVRKLYIEKNLELEKAKFKYLDIYEDFLLSRNKIRELVNNSPDYLFNFQFIKELMLNKDLNGLDKPTGEMAVDSHTIILQVVEKAVEVELGAILSRNNLVDLEKENTHSGLENIPSGIWYEDLEQIFDLDLFKELEKNKIIKLTNDSTKNLEIEKTEVDLIKESPEILVTSIILLSKLNQEIDINKEPGPFFKILNEIHKYKEIMSHILFLYTDYDIEKELEYIQVEMDSKNISQFKDNHLDKNFKVDLSIEESFKKLINNTNHDLYKELKEKVLQNTTINEVEIEECFKQLEVVYEIIINIEEKMKQLDKDFIVELYEEKDIHQLIKKLVIHGLITEDESVQLEESPIGNILLEYSKSLDRMAKEQEIIIDESIPMIKAYNEIMVNDDIQATKTSIEIDVNKEVEFKKVVSEIEIEKNESKIKFNKRFWFLRATDPFDWKVLPYSDYPYRKEPIIFNQDKKIPDNWQLEMIPKLHQEVSEHPMPFGESLGDEEMALSIEIMIDVINIMILIWSRMFYNFSGYTGSQAVIRFTKIIYDWLTLETSIEEMEKKESKEHYFRAYRWIRWEAEKVAIKARDDMTLSGNMYIDEWIFELIYYMENHHFDTMPIFDVVGKMDEFRALLPSDDPQGDINFILDKVKGMRHKIIECKANKSNE